jgi:hypothetical protein
MMMMLGEERGDWRVVVVGDRINERGSCTTSRFVFSCLFRELRVLTNDVL